MSKSPSNQPLSAMSYAAIALIGLLLALGFTFFYIVQVPKIGRGWRSGPDFLPAPNSMGTVERGPPVRRHAQLCAFHSEASRQFSNWADPWFCFALFCLVASSWVLVPLAPETFDLAVRSHSANTPLVTSGQITLDLPGLPHANIGQDGEANFKGVSAKLKGKAIRVLPKVEGYEEKWLTPTVDGNILTADLERAHPTFVQKATLVPPPEGKSIQIRVDGQKIEAAIDDLGGFTFTASGKVGDRVLVEVFVNQAMASSEYHVLSTHPIDIHWTSPSETPKR